MLLRNANGSYSPDTFHVSHRRYLDFGTSEFGNPEHITSGSPLPIIHPFKRDLVYEPNWLMNEFYLQTSKSIRRIIIEKYHWLIQLRNLSQVHAPSLTPDLDIKKLDLLELHEIVLKAALTHRNWKEGKAITGDTHLKSLTIFNGYTMPDICPDVMLAPGGCYVFLIWPYSTLPSIRQKGLIKLYNTEERLYEAWDYCGPEESVDCCAVEMCKDGRMMVLAVSLIDEGLFLEVVSLTPYGFNIKGFESKTDWECGLRIDQFQLGEDGTWSPCISSNHAVVGIDENVMVMNWVENCIFVLNRPQPDSFISKMQIKSDHLIYIDELDGDVWAALTITTLTNSDDVITSSWDLEQLVPARFELARIPECISICDFPWEANPSKSLLTVFLSLREADSDSPEEFCIGVQAVFDPETHERLEFVRRIQVAKYPFPSGRVEEGDTARIICTSQSTRSFLRLTFSRTITEDAADTEGPRDLQEQPQPGTSNSDAGGEAAASRPRETIIMLFYMGLDEHGEIYFTPAPKSTNLDSPDYKFGMEPCSGALTLCNFKRESNKIEITHPNVRHHTFPFPRKYKWLR